MGAFDRVNLKIRAHGIGRCLVVLLAAGWLLATSGCGESGPTVVPVTGVVQRGGQPVPHLFLNFVPANGRPSWGVSDDQGRFTLHYRRGQEGAVVGRHKVFAEYKPADVQAELQMLSGQLQPPVELRAILEKYGTLESTPKEVEITSKTREIILALD